VEFCGKSCGLHNSFLNHGVSLEGEAPARVGAIVYKPRQSLLSVSLYISNPSGIDRS
jgi:hypothetical protein